ncbi:MAG: phage tail tape measure protein [Chloroflexota bacterium]
MSDMTIAVLIRLRDELSNGLTAAAGRLDALGQRAERIGERLEKIGLRIGALGTAANVGLGMAGLGVGDVIKSAIDVEGQLLAIANTAGIAGAAAEQMADKYKTRLNETARATNQTTAELLVAMQDLVSRGMDPDEAVRALTAIGRTATATGSQISDIAKSSFAAMDNLKIPVDQLGASLGKMAQAGNEGAFELRDMAQYFPALTAVAGTLGLEGTNALGQLAAAAQIARLGAGDAASAATNLQNFLLKLNAPDAVKNFQKYGINMADEVKRGLASGDLIGYLSELILKITGGDSAKIATLFQDQQVRQFLAPMLQNIERYKQIRDATLSAGAGVVDTQFDTVLRGTGEKLKAVQIGAQSTVSNSSALDSILEKLQKVADWANEHPDLAGWLAMGAVGAAASGIVIGGAALAIGSTVTAIGGLATAMGGLATFLAANPTVAALLGVAAVGAASFAFGSWLNDQINLSIQAVTGEKGATLGTKIYDMVQAIDKALSDLPRLVGKKIKDTVAAFGGLWRDMLKVGGQVVDGLIEGMKSKLKSMAKAASAAGRVVLDALVETFDIHSPARETWAIGEHVADGLVGGLLERMGAREGEIADLAKKTAELLTPGAQPVEVILADDTRYRRPDGKFGTSAIGRAVEDAQKNRGPFAAAMLEYTETAGKAGDSMRQAFGRAFKGMEDALVNFTKTGKLNFKDMASSIIDDLIRIQVQESITKRLSNALSSLDFGSLFRFANGGAPGGVSAWKNQIVDKPTFFAFAKGGLMGEAGPEAIIPLKRGPDGTLGVRGGAGANVTVNVINNASGTRATARETQDAGGNRMIEVFIEQVKGAIAGDISRGAGSVPDALASTYGLNRVAGAY